MYSVHAFRARVMPSFLELTSNTFRFMRNNHKPSSTNKPFVGSLYLVWLDHRGRKERSCKF